MRAVEEMEYDEIAAQLHLPETTVRSQVSRAKQMILEILKMKG
jgi:DNA-directed RNA polymerase specialized sigma24 family protein